MVTKTDQEKRFLDLTAQAITLVNQGKRNTEEINWLNNQLQVFKEGKCIKRKGFGLIIAETGKETTLQAGDTFCFDLKNQLLSIYAGEERKCRRSVNIKWPSGDDKKIVSINTRADCHNLAEVVAAANGLEIREISTPHMPAHLYYMEFINP